MEYKWSVLFTILAFILVLVNCDEYSSLNETYNIGGSLRKACPMCNTNPRPGPGSPGTQSLVVQGGRDVYNRPITQDPKNPAIPTIPAKNCVPQSGPSQTTYIPGPPQKPIGCCHGAVAVRDFLKSNHFENMFSKRNSLEVEAHAKRFWDYQSFITASAHYQHYGFGTTYMNRKFFGAKEVAAFLAHVATKTSCE